MRKIYLTVLSLILLSCEHNLPQPLKETRYHIAVDHKLLNPDYSEAIVTDSSTTIICKGKDGRIISIHIPTSKLNDTIHSWACFDEGKGKETNTISGEAYISRLDSISHRLSVHFRLESWKFVDTRIIGEIENLSYKTSFPPAPDNFINMPGFPSTKINNSMCWVRFSGSNTANFIQGGIFIIGRALSQGTYCGFESTKCPGPVYASGESICTKHDIINRRIEGYFWMSRSLNNYGPICDSIRGTYSITYY